jgi:hypothetical protein
MGIIFFVKGYIMSKKLKDFDLDDIFDKMDRGMDRGMDGIDSAMEKLDKVFDRSSARLDKVFKGARDHFDTTISAKDGTIHRKASFKSTTNSIGKLKIIGMFLKGVILISLIVFIIWGWMWFADKQVEKDMAPKPLSPIEETTQPKDNSFRKL